MLTQMGALSCIARHAVRRMRWHNAVWSHLMLGGGARFMASRDLRSLLSITAKATVRPWNQEYSDYSKFVI